MQYAYPYQKNSFKFSADLVKHKISTVIKKALLPIRKFWILLCTADDISDLPVKEYSDKTASSSLSEQKLGAERALRIYGDSILRLAYSYMHNMEDAEEILQETLIRRMTSAPVFHESEHEKAWLLRVAGNLCRNKLDYEKRRRSEDIDELSERLSSEEREDLSFVWEAVKSLPVGMREVIHLYYYEGYPTAEIARLLGKNDSTVRSNLRKGRIKLQKILKEAYDFD